MWGWLDTATSTGRSRRPACAERVRRAATSRTLTATVHIRARAVSAERDVPPGTTCSSRTRRRTSATSLSTRRRPSARRSTSKATSASRTPPRSAEVERRRSRDPRGAREDRLAFRCLEGRRRHGNSRTTGSLRRRRSPAAARARSNAAGTRALRLRHERLLLREEQAATAPSAPRSTRRPDVDVTGTLLPDATISRLQAVQRRRPRRARLRQRHDAQHRASPSTFNLTPGSNYTLPTTNVERARSSGSSTWNATTRILDVRGNVFIDGNVSIDGVVKYRGVNSERSPSVGHRRLRRDRRP